MHTQFPLLRGPSPTSACLNAVQSARLRQVLHRLLVKSTSFRNKLEFSSCFATHQCDLNRVVERSQLFAVWPWESYLTSLCLSLVIYNMRLTRMLMCHALYVVVRVK